ncbi:hypothetical protein [Limnothrix redekei]|uniref:Uncharacterized protein n=1 Tax=Limnothrix redekei LRLZ20PSL1 TaxID=3112953 RepID=A0ABW7CE50_9CYAN
MDIVLRSSYTEASLDALEKYTGKSKSYVKSAVKSACLLGMVVAKENGNFATIKECSELLSNKPSDELKVSVFRKWLQAWEPFMIW